MVVSKLWFEFSGGTKFRCPLLPRFNPLFTSMLPLFCSSFSSEGSFGFLSLEVLSLYPNGPKNVEKNNLA